MPAVHEEMHERASQEGQPEQSAEHMSLMLGEQQRSRDSRNDGKAQIDEEIARQASACASLIVSMVWQGHRSIQPIACLP